MFLRKTRHLIHVTFWKTFHQMSSSGKFVPACISHMSDLFMWTFMPRMKSIVPDTQSSGRKPENSVSNGFTPTPFSTHAMLEIATPSKQSIEITPNQYSALTFALAQAAKKLAPEKVKLEMCRVERAIKLE